MGRAGCGGAWLVTVGALDDGLFESVQNRFEHAACMIEREPNGMEDAMNSIERLENNIVEAPRTMVRSWDDVV